MVESLGNRLVTFVDSDYARDPATRRSIAGYIVFMNGGPVAWKCQLQKSVAASTMEAELNAACEGCKETMYLRGLLADLGCEQIGPTSVYSDNQSCIELCKHDSAHHSRSKHIDVRFHFVRDEIKGKTITVLYVPTHWMIADMMTKPVTALTIKRLVPYVWGTWK